MPFFAVTAPPCAPAVGSGTAEDEDEDVGVALAPGTVAFAPSMTWTCPAATVELAVAVTPNSDAILLAAAAGPVPESTSVVGGAAVVPACPAGDPSLARADQTRVANPGGLPQRCGLTGG